MSQYAAEVKQIIKSQKFVQLTANYCPDCVYANNIWQKFGVLNKILQFEIGGFDRATQQKYRDAFEQVTGSRNLPTIFVDGKVWGTEHDLHKYERKGTLQAELKKIGLI
ncbi:LANO_0H17854g1_1 [Lachancea nothofagi CBS 11611]|uniref:LANO_0H17854g1_1 n=1 Tax=Lachancea nothofagi CBS 11611 TaxID=1266666 RepID=A0A1G4KN62_9SACH|nr:LANO_0H17854g1_1 [Lachancea nothofagi CBS 11611]